MTLTMRYEDGTSLTVACVQTLAVIGPDGPDAVILQTNTWGNGPVTHRGVTHFHADYTHATYGDALFRDAAREECPVCEGDGFGPAGGNCATCGGGGRVSRA